MYGGKALSGTCMYVCTVPRPFVPATGPRETRRLGSYDTLTYKQEEDVRDSMYVRMYVLMLVCMYAYITYIHSYIHTYVHTS